jgi:protein-disulfide isomerase
LSLDRRALIASGAALAAASPAMARAAKALYPVDGDMVMGSAKAPVQLVVYASASCPHCAHWWTTRACRA